MGLEEIQNNVHSIWSVLHSKTKKRTRAYKQLEQQYIHSWQRHRKQRHGAEVFIHNPSLQAHSHVCLFMHYFFFTYYYIEGKGPPDIRVTQIMWQVVFNFRKCKESERRATWNYNETVLNNWSRFLVIACRLTMTFDVLFSGH